MSRNFLRRQRDSYSLKDKLEVVQRANEIGRNKAARQYDIDATLVERWMKWYTDNNFDFETSENKNSKRIGASWCEFFVDEENVLYQWVLQLRSGSLVVNYTSLKLKMLDLVQVAITESDNSNKKE